MKCDHRQAVPVDSVTGELLAALCPDCDTQLPAEFLGCQHTSVFDITSLDQPTAIQLCNDCNTMGCYRSGSSVYGGMIGYWLERPA